MKATLRSSLTFAAVFLLIAGCGGPERKVYQGGTKHMPLREHRVMRYQDFDGSETNRYTMRMYYLGGRSIKVYGVRYKGLTLPDAQFLADDSTVTYATPQPLTTLDLLAEYREMWLTEPAQPGQSWENWDTGTFTTFTGYENVTVPAGTYRDCYKTVTRTMDLYADSLTAWLQRAEIDQKYYDEHLALTKVAINRWFAPDVGLVKEQIGVRVRELVEIEDEGKGEPDTTNAESPTEIQG